LEIMEGLRGHMSGLAIPTYVVDAPHGGGKIPLLPNYLVSASDDCVVLRNYEGMLVRYQAEDKAGTSVPTANRGVSQLIQGTKTAIIPPDSERMERRRQYLQNAAADKPKSCCDDHPAEPKPHATPKNGRKRMTALPVVS
jgi:lysine 2,3-aminomutase